MPAEHLPSSRSLPSGCSLSGEGDRSQIISTSYLRGLNIRWRVHSFPVAVITNYHQLCALEQQTFILSRFSRPDVQNQYHWAAIKVSAGPRFWWRLQGRVLPASSSVWGLPAVLGSWPHHPSLCLCGHVPFPCQCQISHRLRLVRTPVVAFRAHLAHPGESLLI